MSRSVNYHLITDRGEGGGPPLVREPSDLLTVRKVVLIIIIETFLVCLIGIGFSAVRLPAGWDHWSTFVSMLGGALIQSVVLVSLGLTIIEVISISTTMNIVITTIICGLIRWSRDLEAEIVVAVGYNVVVTTLMVIHGLRKRWPALNMCQLPCLRS